MLGAGGEYTARLIIHEAGLHVLERNWRDGRRGELDIIARDDTDPARPYTVVVEVRTRVGRARGSALASVDPRKVARLRALTGAWCRQRGRLGSRVRIDVVALTLDADGRVTSAIGDMAEPALTIAADGGVTAPDTVRSKLELGDSYGMRNASSLGKEWYEHSEGYCSYLKGKTEKEVADIPADGSDADLAALCTISIDALQKAAGDAFENASL